MVTQVAEVVDQEPVEAQTEDAPQLELELDAAAAEQAEAAATPEETAETDRIAKLEADLAELRRRDEERAKAQERERRQRQREGAAAANEQARRQADEAEATELLQAQLGRVYRETPVGADPDATAVKPILERYVQKRESQVTTRTLADVADAYTAAAAEALGEDHDVVLSPRGEVYAQNFAPFVKSLMERARDSLAKSSDFIPRSELPALVDAEIAKRNAKNREGKTEIKRPNGAAPVPRDNSHQAIIDRVARGLGDAEDEKYAADYVAGIRRR